MASIQHDSANKIKNQSYIDTKYFTTSMILDDHPLRRSKLEIKARYIAVLEHFVTLLSHDNAYIEARMLQYHKVLLGCNSSFLLNEQNCDDIIRNLVNNTYKPWRRKYRFWLLCDIMFILLGENGAKHAYSKLQKYLTSKQAVALEELHKVLHSKGKIPKSLLFVEQQILRFRSNANFGTFSEKRCLFTANISAGKSTLINAIVGKIVAKTAQETCTTNLLYIYNKPFEDKAVHIHASPLNLNATQAKLMEALRISECHVSSYFRTWIKQLYRICIIDTPGVNSAFNRETGNLTKRALTEERYDTLIYIFNANKLGSDEEFRYLKYISKNVPRERTVFVINKLDDFNQQNDSIEESICRIKEDLMSFGYENPKVYPLSAYFAFLIKMKQNGEHLNEDEEDYLKYLISKFNIEDYDLSKYYRLDIPKNATDELTVMGIKSGLFGLENVLFGG